MSMFENLKRLFAKIFKKNNKKELVSFDVKEIEPLPIPKESEFIEFPEGEIVSFSDEILDTTSKESEEKLKHNLEILIKRAKETGKIDKFMLIREDDFFPEGWEWRVLSKNTNLEKVCTCLSYELRRAYALEKSRNSPYKNVKGIKIPNVTDKQILEALSQIDKTFGFILLPSRFRSTKHFTINTPLAVTGDYNSVSTDRDYIVIDDISNFLDSEYGYSVSYHDAYLDISHESLPISSKAVVLINEENYKRIMSDEKVANELSKRRIVRFKGDEVTAINMILTEMGALPSKIGTRYANYDKEIYDILDSSMRELANKNGLFFDKSHGGELKPEGGHFSNYYDDKNKDYEKAIQEFITFMRQKFPEHEELFSEYLINTESGSQEIVEKIGTTNLFKAINDYNELVSERAKKTLKAYEQDRKNITPEVHQIFVETVRLINDFYKCNIHHLSHKEEEIIQNFIQGETVSEQLEAAKSVWKLILNYNKDKKIPPLKAIKGALEETTTHQTYEAKSVVENLENIKKTDKNNVDAELEK